MPPAAPRDGLSAIDFAFAFQPIVSMRCQQIVAHEALARGPAGQSAGSVLEQVTWENRHQFNLDCKDKAIAQAVSLDIDGALSINFIPNALGSVADCVRQTIELATERNFPLSRLIFEMTENERLLDPGALIDMLGQYRKLGIKTAIDDFGAGYAGLNLLAQFQPDIVKLDMELIRDVDSSIPKQIIVGSVIDMCRQLKVVIVAEGVESTAERDYLYAAGIDFMQGYLFARPAFMALPGVDAAAWPVH